MLTAYAHVVTALVSWHEEVLFGRHGWWLHHGGGSGSCTNQDRCIVRSRPCWYHSLDRDMELIISASLLGGPDESHTGGGGQRTSIELQAHDG